MLSPLRNRAGKRLREPFGKAGLMVAVIALVFAMLGGAYAATNDGGKATASAKAKKGPRGPKGPAGPAGGAGGQGPAGPAGPKGDTGSKGDKGDTGLQGKEGSPGKEGKQGKEGSPWTLGGTLPPGKTETGAWAVGIGPTGVRAVSLSFTIRLAAAMDATQVHYLNEAGEEVVGGTTQASADCHGTAANPGADPGNLCVYTGTESEFLLTSEQILKPDFSGGATPAGAILLPETGESGLAFGTWAVTAEE